MPKKNNPGCNCCGGEDCTTRCMYKCEGTPCVFPCAIQIDTPTPDVVSESNGPTCPDADCDLSVQCFQCRALFDGLFYLNPGATLIRENWFMYGWTGPSCEDQTMEFTFDGEGTFGIFSACWGYDNYLCPEPSYLWDFSQCVPEYSVVASSAKITVHVTYSAGCSTTEVEIEYKVRQACDEVAIPPNPPTSPETTYTHLFRRTNQCNCSDILGAITYVSTTSVNNSRGVTVPDVCNMADAVLTLIENATTCGCECLVCMEPRNQRTLTVTGGDYAGTYLLDFDNLGVQVGSPEGPIYSQCFFNSAEFGESLNKWRLEVYCKPCEKLDFKLFLMTPIEGGGLNATLYAEAISVDCSDPLTLNTVVGAGTYDLS